MALGRAILLVVFAAILASVSGPAQGLFVIDSPAWPTANVGLNENSYDGTQMATTYTIPPVEFDAGCSCEKLTHCSCQVKLDSNLMGRHIEFNPQVHVEFIENNVSLRVYVTNQDEVLLTRDFLGESFIPPLCVPIPQFPAIQFCLEVHNLTSNLDNKSAGLCLVVGVRAMGVTLPANVRPTLPVGCFSATLGKELAYMPPTIQIPGFENSKPILTDKITVPLNPQLIWPFGETASFGEQQNKKRDVNSMNFPSNTLFKFNA